VKAELEIQAMVDRETAAWDLPVPSLDGGVIWSIVLEGRRCCLTRSQADVFGEEKPHGGVRLAGAFTSRAQGAAVFGTVFGGGGG
jgi:hypothetical protein